MHGACEMLGLVLFIVCGLLICLYTAAYLLCPSTVFSVFMSITDSSAVV